MPRNGDPYAICSNHDKKKYGLSIRTPTAPSLTKEMSRNRDPYASYSQLWQKKSHGTKIRTPIIPIVTKKISRNVYLYALYSIRHEQIQRWNPYAQNSCMQKNLRIRKLIVSVFVRFRRIRMFFSTPQIYTSG